MDKVDTCISETKFNSVFICFQLSNCVVFLSVVLYCEKNVKKLLRNFEYWKSQKAKELSVMRPELSFL